MIRGFINFRLILITIIIFMSIFKNFKNFTFDWFLQTFKLIYIIAARDDSLKDRLKKQLADPIRALGSDTYYSIDVYNPDQSLLVIHGMKTRDRVAQVATYLSEKNNKVTALPNMPIAIATKNYEIVQVYKSLEEYINREP